jgi:hypothetical protein
VLILLINFGDNDFLDHWNNYFFPEGKQQYDQQQKETSDRKEPGSHIIKHGPKPPSQAESDEEQEKETNTIPAVAVEAPRTAFAFAI